MKRLLILVLLFSATGSLAQSPRAVHSRNMAWGGVLAEYRFKPSWTVSLDAQFRYEYTDGDIFQWCLRPGLTYKTKPGILLTLGVVHFSLYPNPNGKVPRPELRPWQEVGMKFGTKHVFYPRIRFEQRYIREYAGEILAENYSFHSVRVRIRLDYTFFLDAEKRFSLIAGNELFFYRKPGGFSAYDQNRAWAGAGYKFTPNFGVQLSYLNLYQQRDSSTFDQFHVVRVVLQFLVVQKQKETK